MRKSRPRKCRCRRCAPTRPNRIPKCSCLRASLLHCRISSSQAGSSQRRIAGIRRPRSWGCGRAGGDYLRAEHELEYRQALFDLLLKQYDAARWDEARNAAVIQVVEAAIPPDRKSAPHRTLIVLVFTALGLFGVWAYILGRNMVANNTHIAQLLAEFKSVPVNE